MNTQNATYMVPLRLAEQWTHAWQNNTDPAYVQEMAQIQSFTFHAVDFSQILNKPGVVGVRTYPAIKTQNGVTSVTLLVVGVNNQDVDIISSDPHALDSGIYDFAAPCPNTCGTSPLYSQQ
ncbi:MAG: hypothetical protein MI810_17395 [Flavobacteriales bacterium]|nr:hypothetical protein [Flavobacteriales bacterium]